MLPVPYVPGNRSYGIVAASIDRSPENPAPSVQVQYVNHPSPRQQHQQHTPAADPPNVTPAQPSTAAMRPDGLNSEYEQLPKNSTAASPAPVIAVASRVSASGGVASAGASADTSVDTDGYEDYSGGTWEPLPEVAMTSSEAGPHVPPRAKLKILILCGGPNSRENSLFQLFNESAVFECVNYDLRNGQQFDLTDDAVHDPLANSVAEGEYVACFACPDCSTFSKLHSLPGPPPYRDVEGRGRYGRDDLTPERAEKVRKQTIVVLRIARILASLTRQGIPWIFECPWASENMVSVLNLDEYRALLRTEGVEIRQGTQCQFGAVSSKPRAWVHYLADIAKMPTKCSHAKRYWFNQDTGAVVFKAQKPTAGKVEYALTPPAT